MVSLSAEVIAVAVFVRGQRGSLLAVLSSPFYLGPMFEDLRVAWKQAVENFWTELQGEEGPATLTGMRREIAEARSDLTRLESEVRRTRSRVAEEHEEASTARRRAEMARRIGDEETARIAEEYAAKHDERAAVLERKVSALEAEARLWERDVAEMQDAVRRQESALGMGPGADETLDETSRREDREFSRLEENDRMRTAEERLEELKQRMQRRGGG